MCKTPELFSAAADTAFVVGCLALFGSRIPSTLRLFLLSLAIFDDVGAILVMAADYGDALNWSALAIGLFGLAVVAASARLGIRSICLSPGLRIARPTAGLNCPFLAAGAFLTGIGFTISLFIANLAYSPTLLSAAKLGILAGSVASAAVGLTVLAWLTGSKRTSRKTADGIP